MTKYLRWIATGALLLGISLPVAAQTPSSASLAKELVGALEERNLHDVAARLQGGDDRFAAALYVPKSELLVVVARYPVPVLLQEQIYNHKYGDVYMALHGSGASEGKLFVEDIGANGLAAKAGEDGRFDIIYRDVTQRTLLTGDWKEQKISEGEYKERFDAVEATYAEALAALLGQLRKTS
jgi:hypothetical protein